MARNSKVSALASLGNTDLSDLQQTAFFSSFDVERAVETARDWLKYNYPDSPSAPKWIEKTVLDIFERWKAEFVLKKIEQAPLEDTNPLVGLFDPSIGISSEQERQKRLDTVRSKFAWEVASYWRGNPIELYISIWSSDFIKMNAIQFADCLSALILLSDQKGVSLWRPSIVNAAHRVARMHCILLKYDAEENAKFANAKRKQQSALLSQNEQNKEKGKQTKHQVWQLAEHFLKKGIKPRNIVSAINGEMSRTQEQIRHHLKDHPSGHWSPKKRPKSK